MTEQPAFRLRRSNKAELSPLWVWETPQEDMRYYIGADAARGLLSTDGQAKGDYSAAVCWNGYTGNQAFTFAARCGVDKFSWVLNGLGRLYNKALLNPEVTGGDGAQVFKNLRDIYHYPRLYGWLGKDEKLQRQYRPSLGGWETTWKTRQKLLVVFREYLKPPEGKKHGFLKIRDARLVQQMGFAQLDDLEMRWNVKRGHDDIFMAAALGAIAINQYPPPVNAGLSRRLLDEENDEDAREFFWLPEPVMRLREKFLRLRGVKPIQEDRLAGI